MRRKETTNKEETNKKLIAFLQTLFKQQNELLDVANRNKAYFSSPYCYNTRILFLRELSIQKTFILFSLTSFCLFTEVQE